MKELFSPSFLHDLLYTIPGLFGNTVSYSEMETMMAARKRISSGILNFSATNKQVHCGGCYRRPAAMLSAQSWSNDPLSPGTPRLLLLTGEDNMLLQISPFPAATDSPLHCTGEGCADPGHSNSRHQRVVQECDRG